MSRRHHCNDYVSRINGYILSDLDANGNRINNMRDPVNDGDAVTKAYADANFIVNSGTSLNLQNRPITNLAPGVNPTDAVNVNQLSNYVKKSGDTMTGNLNMNSLAITSTYWNSTNTTPTVLPDDFCVTYGGLKRDVLLKNSPATTNLNMNNNSIINVAEPVNSSDAATKSYVDRTVKKITEVVVLTFNPRAMNSIINISTAYSWQNKNSSPIIILSAMVVGSSNCIQLKPSSDATIVSGAIRAINTSSSGIDFKYYAYFNRLPVDYYYTDNLGNMKVNLLISYIST